MEKFEKAKKISVIVFYSIWLVVALSLWIFGLTMFMEHSGFESWVIWGAACVVPIIIPILKMTFDQAKKGARDGANEYSASVVGNTVYVENHPIRGAISGLIGGIFGGLLVGPIMLAIYIIKNALALITAILELKRAA
ncbi:MAG: hypothetical protein J6Q85_00365 [Clostridia bacterium]|nr:hypothetical protein [Clostridia bacterium]